MCACVLARVRACVCVRDLFAFSVKFLMDFLRYYHVVLKKMLRHTYRYLLHACHSQACSEQTPERQGVIFSCVAFFWSV